MNCWWQELTRTPVAAGGILLLAVLMMAGLFVAIRGVASKYSQVVNAIFVGTACVLVGTLFVGGEAFFRLSLKMESRSRLCWFQDGRARALYLTREDKRCLRSCPPIKNYIGYFVPIKNSDMALFFFGVIVLKTAIELLLAFP